MDKSITLYDLSNEYIELYNALIDTADYETGEVDVDISAALEKIKGAFVDKAIATAKVCRMLGNYSAEIDNEIKRLQALKKHVDNECDKVKNYLQESCERTETYNIKSIYANISFRKSEQTIIDDEKLLDKEYLTEKITYTPNKTAIKSAIKAGKEVLGAHIEVKNNIQIK